MTTQLTKLTLKNFKSFKKAEIPISKGFTAIVGSNGSGKSNVLDALLFVLGITSLKTLRASKLVDLVNNDCKENYAKVSLDLKANGKEYEISRMIDKMGKSVYRLDGKRTTLNEISSLLVELGIDVSGHNIVTQGDITKIIEMSPIERREIVDNVAGLSEFDQKKDEAVKELDKVDSRIKEATIILNERNNFLSELEKEMDSAKEFSTLEKEKKSIKATIIWKEVYAVEKKLVEVDRALKGLLEEKDKSDAEIEKITTDLSKSKTISNELAKKAVQSSEELYTKIGKAYEEKKALLGVELEKINSRSEIVKRNENKIEENNSQNSEKSREKENFKAKKESLERSLKEISSEITDIAKKKEELKKLVENKSKEIALAESELDSLNKLVEEKRSESFDLEVFVRNWEKQKNFNQKKIAELVLEKESTKQQLDIVSEKKKQIKDVKGGKNLEQELETIQITLEEITIEKNKVQGSVEQNKKAVAELKKEISKCPVCDSTLEKDKKMKIINQKVSENEKLEKEIEQNSKKIAILKDDMQRTQEKIYLLNKLEAEIASEIELDHKLKAIELKLKELTAEIDERSFEAQLSKKRKLDEQLKAEITKRESIKEKLKSSRSQNIFTEYSLVSKAHEEKISVRINNELSINKLASEIALIENREGTFSNENFILEKEIEEAKEFINKKEPLIKQLQSEISEKDKELIEAKKQNNALMKQKEQTDKEIERLEKHQSNEVAFSRKIETKINESNIEKSKLEVKQIDLKEESIEFEGIEHVGERTSDELKERIEDIEKRLNQIGAVNLKAVDNFNELKLEVDDIQKKADKLQEERFVVLDMIDKIDVKRTTVFTECFNEINHNFSDMFNKFFNGEGKLSLTNQDTPLESGLLIDAQPKGGKLQNIDSMSGGEKTLTALAFMFAIQLYSPAPFYAFDEADAALDKENSLKMGNLIEKIAQKSQFISVTHNDTITKKADQIIGIAVSKDNSSVIGLKLKNRE